MHWLVICLAMITGVIVYFSAEYIRKMNQVLKLLQEIEANTRAIVGTAAVQRLAPRQRQAVSVVRHGLEPESSVRV
jgi:hypothetical protein